MKRNLNFWWAVICLHFDQRWVLPSTHHSWSWKTNAWPGFATKFFWSCLFQVQSDFLASWIPSLFLKGVTLSSIPRIIPQSSQPNIPSRLFILIHNPLRPSNSQRSTKFLHLFLPMDSPELPWAFRSCKGLDDSFAARMLCREIGTVVDDFVNYNIWKNSSVSFPKPKS